MSMWVNTVQCCTGGICCYVCHTLNILRTVYAQRTCWSQVFLRHSLVYTPCLFPYLHYMRGKVYTQGSHWISNMCLAQFALRALPGSAIICVRHSLHSRLFSLGYPVCVWNSLHSGFFLDLQYVCGTDYGFSLCVCTERCVWVGGWELGWGGVGGGGSQEGSTRQNDSEIETERRSERETNIESHRDKHDTIKFMFSQHFCSGLT